MDDGLIKIIMGVDSYIRFSAIMAFYIGISGAFIAIIILSIQNFTLSRQLDKHILNKKYFNEYELNIYMSFPLSLIKIIAYQVGIVFPKIMEKRFHDFYIRNYINSIDFILSYICVIFLIVSPLTFMNLITAYLISR